MRFIQQFRLGLAKTHRFAARALHLPRQENPHAEKGDQRQAVDEQGHQPGIAVRRRLGGDRDVLLVERVDQRGVARRVGHERPIVVETARNIRPGDRDFANMALIDLLKQLAEGDFAAWRLLPGALKQSDQGKHKKENDHPEREIPEIRVHSHPIAACRSPTPRGGSSCSKTPFKRTRPNCQGKRICLNVV